MTYESNQDWGTTMARICCISLGGSPSLRRYRQEYYRTETSEGQAQFEKHLHEAMGYRAEHSDPLQF